MSRIDEIRTRLDAVLKRDPLPWYGVERVKSDRGVPFLYVGDVPDEYGHFFLESAADIQYLLSEIEPVDATIEMMLDLLSSTRHALLNGTPAERQETAEVIQKILTDMEYEPSQDTAE